MQQIAVPFPDFFIPLSRRLRAVYVRLRHPLAMLSLAMAALLLSILWQAAVMEDGYITFRVVDNFVNGEGFRWNLHERVQAYTNPLWMILHIPFYAIYPDIFAVTITVSLVCTEIALFLVLATFRKPPLATVCLFLIPLALSRSFAAYSTSGFENSLEHVLFAWFGWIALRARPRYFWLLLSGCTALSMVNRLDTIVLYAPVWGYLLYSRKEAVNWRQIALGALPIVGWELFSLFYYGFLFPNTKYAKLNTGIGELEYLGLGVSYLLNLFVVDLTGAIMLFGAIGTIPLLWKRYKKDRGDRTALFLSVAVGICAYMLYVVVVGGTYLSGRFLSLQIFAAVWLLLGLFGDSLQEKRLFMLAGALCLIKISVPSAAFLHEKCPICYRGVDDLDKEDKSLLSDYVQGKIKLVDANTVHIPDEVHLEWSMGKWGYSLDRTVKVIDGFALVDPLLARLPLSVPHIITMGMTPRNVPEGYVEALKTGSLDKMDPDLAAYYSKLRLIISGDLLSGERLFEILKFNLGAYDYLRDMYVQKNHLGPNATKPYGTP